MLVCSVASICCGVANIVESVIVAVLRWNVAWLGVVFVPVVCRCVVDAALTSTSIGSIVAPVVAFVLSDSIVWKESAKRLVWRRLATVGHLRR